MNFIYKYNIYKIRYDRGEITSVKSARNLKITQCSQKRLRKYI